MVGVVFRIIEINPGYVYFLFMGFIVALFLALIYFIWLSVNNLTLTRKQQAERLRLLREFSDHGPKIASWLREHKEELERQPMVVLNDQEFVDLVNRDQELYEIILEIYPDYPDTVMPPKELRQYFIELAQGQHKQTH